MYGVYVKWKETSLICDTIPNDLSTLIWTKHFSYHNPELCDQYLSSNLTGQHPPKSKTFADKINSDDTDALLSDLSNCRSRFQHDLFPLHIP